MSQTYKGTIKPTGALLLQPVDVTRRELQRLGVNVGMWSVGARGFMQCTMDEEAYSRVRATNHYHTVVMIASGQQEGT